MMGTKTRNTAPLIHISLEDLVPQDHFYRQLGHKLNLSLVYAFVQENYAQGGRPSIDPIVFFKLQLVMFFEGIRAERQLMCQASDRLSVRWYLGYNLDEALAFSFKLDAHSHAVWTRSVSSLFRDGGRPMPAGRTRVGKRALCGCERSVQANAAVSSLKPRFAVEAHLKTLFPKEEEPNKLRGDDSLAHSFPRVVAEIAVMEELAVRSKPQEAQMPHQLHSALDEEICEELAKVNSERHDWMLRGGEPNREVMRGNYQRLADFQVSTTDPDATLMQGTGGGSHLGYHTQYVVDGGKARIILEVLVTPSEVMENQPVLDLLWHARARWKLHPRQFTGDTTYGTAENIVALEEQHIRAYVPLPDFDQRTEFFGQRAFRYDAEGDVYLCPNNAELHVLPSGCTDQYLQYRAKASACNSCPLKAKCTTSNTGRRLSRHVAEEYLERVRTYHATEPYKKAIRKRSVWVEPLKACGKDWHGMRRYRLRRL